MSFSPCQEQTNTNCKTFKNHVTGSVCLCAAHVRRHTHTRNGLRFREDAAAAAPAGWKEALFSGWGWGGGQRTRGKWLFCHSCRWCIWLFILFWYRLCFFSCCFTDNWITWKQFSLPIPLEAFIQFFCDGAGRWQEGASGLIPSFSLAFAVSSRKAAIDPAPLLTIFCVHPHPTARFYLYFNVFWQKEWLLFYFEVADMKKGFIFLCFCLRGRTAGIYHPNFFPTWFFVYPSFTYLPTSLVCHEVQRLSMEVVSGNGGFRTVLPSLAHQCLKWSTLSIQ